MSGATVTPEFFNVNARPSAASWLCYKRFRTMKRRFLPPGASLVGAGLPCVVVFLIFWTSIAGQSQSPVPSGTNPVALLDRQIQSREVKLEYQTGGLGFLPSLLAHLDINADSQMLVFSK